MIRLFKNIHPSTLFFIPVIALILWIPGFVKENFLITEFHGIISPMIMGMVGVLPRFLQVLLTILLLSFEAIYLNLIVNRHEVLFKNTYLPALFYIILMSFNKDIITFNETLIVNLLLIIASDKIFSLFKNESPVALIFDSGLLLSIASLIYFPGVLLILFLLIVLIILRPFSFREWSIAIISFLLPYLFIIIYLFLTDSLNNLTGKFIPYLSLTGIFHDFSLTNGEGGWLKISTLLNGATLPFVLFLLFMLVLSLIRLRNNYYKNTIKTRSTQQVMITLCIFIFIEIILSGKTDIRQLTQLSIPFSVFLAYYYATAQKRLWLFETSFWIFIAFIIHGYLY